MKEKEPSFEDVVGRIERAQGKASQEGVASFAEAWGSPEEGAEQLYALWRGYQRKRDGLANAYREKRKEPAVEGESPRNRARRIRASVDAETELAPLRAAIQTRFRDVNVRTVFESTLERECAEREQLAPTYENYLRLKERKNGAEDRRLTIYSDIFSHRKKEPEELTLLELTDLSVRISLAEREMNRMEQENPALSARLSFERIRMYKEQLNKDGFVWTPSRQKFFEEILSALVKLNKNRPIFLYGETGTGKSELARAASRKLTGRDPYEVGEEAKTDIRPLLGAREIQRSGTVKKGKTLITYGKLGQAISGKRAPQQDIAGPGGIFYMDEMNGYPPDALRSLIKQVTGKRHGDVISFSSWYGNEEKVAPRFGFIGSGNLPSEKHPDRPALTPELARELRPAAIEVEYPPQSAEDPELYEMMLAALMDQNDRIRVSQEELSPQWKEVVDVRTNTKRFEIDTDPKVGGTLWRFANFIAETQESYQGRENILTPQERDASYLGGLSPLDIGIVIDWLQEYRKSEARSQKLSVFLTEKITKWRSHKLDSEEDRSLMKKFQEAFALS